MDTNANQIIKYDLCPFEFIRDNSCPF